MKRIGYVRGLVANHQDYAVFSEVHFQSGKELNVALCTEAAGPSFDYWDSGKVEYVHYTNPNDLLDKFDILDVSEFYREYSQEILRNFKGKKVVTVFDNMPFANSYGQAGEMVKSFGVDKVIARSSMIKNMLELEGVPPDKISVVPSAVNTKLFKPGIFKGTFPAVLFCGRLVPEKGLDDLIIAMSGLDAELLVAGSGDTQYYQSLATMAGTQVKFLGEIKHSELNRFLSQGSVLVLPSVPTQNWIEQFGVIIIEAMACGLPVICSDTGSTRDIIVDGETGYLFPPKSWDILRFQIKSILGSFGLRNEMGTQGRRRVERLFSSDVVGKKLAGVYLSL